MNREEFPMLDKNLIYFDNAATSFKPQMVIDEIVKYYEHYSASAHRSDYKLSHKVDDLYEKTRIKVQKFINAKENSEVIFTTGTTEAINIVANGYLRKILKKGDEILVTKSEHASLLLPIFSLVNDLGVVLKYIPLNQNHKVTIENVNNSITPKTKVIAIAHISNVIGDLRPIRQICDLATENKIITLIDGAQSVAHTKINVLDLGVDFYCFSGHKMYGPTGIGILYGKQHLLEKVEPLKVGGGMNASFYSDGIVEYKDLPDKLEAGTQNIAGILGLAAAVEYLTKTGLYCIETYEKQLAKYLVEKLKELDNITIYNENPDSSIITFNVDDIFSQDVAFYLDKHNICIRSGNHCAKILNENLGIKNTCRISLAMYNNEEEIDKLVEVLKNKNILEEIL